MRGNVSEAKVFESWQPEAKALGAATRPGRNAASFRHSKESPMARFRLQPPLSISDFEKRSVQLMAACALGLAGIASVQVAPPTRHALNVFTPSRMADTDGPVRLSRELAISSDRKR
jgi:hypothetical protein